MSLAADKLALFSKCQVIFKSVTEWRSRCIYKIDNCSIGPSLSVFRRFGFPPPCRSVWSDADFACAGAVLAHCRPIPYIFASEISGISDDCYVKTAINNASLSISIPIFITLPALTDRGQSSLHLSHPSSRCICALREAAILRPPIMYIATHGTRSPAVLPLYRHVLYNEDRLQRSSGRRRSRRY